MEDVIAKTQTELSNHGSLRNLELTVSAKGDKLVLTGNATTFYQKQVAGHVAMQASPDVSIENEIKVA